MLKLIKFLILIFVFQTLDLSLGISHLKGNVFKEMMDLLIKWLPIFLTEQVQRGFNAGRICDLAE